MDFTLQGQSGKTYTYKLHPYNINWNDCGGCYAFARRNQDSWQIVYIGLAQSFCNRLGNHDRWEEASNLGATHVFARSIADEYSRQVEEKDLIAYYQPELNTHHKPQSLLDSLSLFGLGK